MPVIALHVSPTHPAFAGHFPGQPLLPGVSLLAEVLEAILDEPALAALVGESPRITSAKFLAPVRPVGNAAVHLAVHLEPTPRGVRFEVRDGDRVTASGQFENSR